MSKTRRNPIGLKWYDVFYDSPDIVHIISLWYPGVLCIIMILQVVVTILLHTLGKQNPFCKHQILNNLEVCVYDSVNCLLWNIRGCAFSAYPIVLGWEYVCFILLLSEVWIISHRLGLGHETMLCAVCLAMLLWRYGRWHGIFCDSFERTTQRNVNLIADYF